MPADPGSPALHADAGPGPENADALIGAPLDAMQEWARQVRDSTHGNRITFSPKVFIPLTMLCRDRCGYCTFANAAALEFEDLVRLREVTASQGMMIESVNPDLGAHRSAPDKDPARRLATLEAAGRAQVPFTTGLLVGIGESRAARLATLEAIAAGHRRHGHVQEVIVQNFLPKPGTSMHRSPPCPTDEFLWTIAAARLVLPPDIHLLSLIH